MAKDRRLAFRLGMVHNESITQTFLAGKIYTMQACNMRQTALPSETHWGEDTLDFRFADINFRVNGLNIDQCQALSRLYEPLSASQNCTRDDDIFETWVCSRPPFPEYDPDRYNKNGIYTPIVHQHECGIEIDGIGFQAVINFKPQLRGLLWAHDGDLLATLTVFENYLRIFAAYAILMRGGLLLHSAGIVADNQAYLFMGCSGAGKTTLSRLALAEGVKILSDDINIVIPSQQGGYTVGAVPFAGELGHDSLEQSGRYPLKGLFWLEKSLALSYEKISASGQLAKVLACCPVVNADARQLDRILATGACLLSSTPMYLLRFRRDDAFSNIHKILRESANIG